MSTTSIPKKTEAQKVEDSIDLPPWDVEKFNEEALAPTQMPTNESIKTVEKTAPKTKAKSPDGCAYAAELIRELGSNDPLFASFCTNLTMQEEGSVLVIYGESFTITMLTARQQEILDLAKKHSPSLTGVRFSEGKPRKIKTVAADLSDF